MEVYTTVSSITGFDGNSTDNATNSTVAAPRLCAASETDSIELKAFKATIYSILMLVAFVGNMFIIIVVYKNKAMRKTTNIFIANMAASDMIVAILVIPKILVELYNGPSRWLISGVFGEITCKINFFAVEFSFFISLLSHTVIAIDRFWAIVYSLRPSPFKSSRRNYIIVLIWMIVCLYQTPYLYSIRLKNINGKSHCVLDWHPLDNLKMQRTIYLISFVTFFFIPVSIMVALYAALLVSLIRNKNCTATQTSQVKRKRKKEDIVVLRKVVILLTVFFVSLVPIQSLQILWLFVWNAQMPCNAQAWGFSFTAFFLFLSNSAVNPCLCIFMYKSYRRKVKKLFPWKHLMNVTSPLSSINSLKGTGNGDINNTSEKRQTADKALELIPMSNKQ